jgi:hypothetical protein
MYPASFLRGPRARGISSLVVTNQGTRGTCSGVPSNLKFGYTGLLLGSRTATTNSAWTPGSGKSKDGA